MRALWVLTLTGGLLVGLHKGEFWPFSIYPMFSQAGRPWERVIVRDLSQATASDVWQVSTLETLPGRPFAVEQHDIPQNDLTKYVKLTRAFTDDRLAGLHRLFEPSLKAARGPSVLVVYRVRGDVDRASGTSVTTATPLVKMTRTGAETNPELGPSARSEP